MLTQSYIYQIIKEATGGSTGSSGPYNEPMQPGVRIFEKDQLSPYTIPVSKYIDAELEYDSYDGKMSSPKKKIKKMESNARKISQWKKDHPTISDDDGDVINPYPSKLNEWVEITEDTVDEDLAVWFGTKKKPKGSSQPKGPWVNICKKVDGKHPPCGRPEASDKAYPKCRAAGVAGKMSDSQKKAACQQKRRAEKTNPKSGKGNPPKMVSYKPRKTNEDIEILVNKILNEIKNK